MAVSNSRRRLGRAKKQVPSSIKKDQWEGNSGARVVGLELLAECKDATQKKHARGQE